MTSQKELSPELIADLMHVTDVQLSVRGLAAYVLCPWGKREEHEEAAIWVAPTEADAGPPRQFTAGTANDRQPRWSPDGARLAFLSDRKERGTAQLYLMTADGGEAEALTEGKKSVAGFEWSPDGSSIAFTAADDPTEEDERRREERDDRQVFGERWEYAGLRMIDRVSREVCALLEGDCHVEHFCWSPDGGWIACVLRPTPELDAEAGPGTIVAVSRGGEQRELCRLRGAVEGMTYSSDGRWLLLLRSVDEHAQASHAVWRLPAEGGELQRIAGGEEHCILGLARTVGEKKAICLLAEGLRSRLCLLDPVSGSLETIYAPERGSFHAASLLVREGSPGAKAPRLLLAVALSLPSWPAELHAGDPAASLRRLTDHHRELEGVHFGRQEEFRWTAPDGLELDGILIRPPGYGGNEPLPAVVLVHGGPYGRWEDGCHLSWGDWGQWLAAAGYAVLMPNPRGGYGHGGTFAAAVRGDVGGADWLDVLAAVDAAVERGIADPARLGIGGWSQGGFMTAWAVTQTDRFKAGIDGAGPTEWGWMAATSDMGHFEAELGGSTPWDGPGPHRHAAISPLSYARRVTTPLLILHGEKDERVPLSQATGFHRALRESGATVEMVIYPREPHGIQERNHQLDLLRRVREWYEKYLRA